MSTLGSLTVAVIKRNGTAATFQAAKIVDALASAGRATGEFGQDRASGAGRPGRGPTLARRVPTVEQVQDQVERTLSQAGHFDTARAYIVYREQRQMLRTDAACAVDVERSVNEYLSQQDWRVNANANQGYSLGGLILNVSGKVIANYWLTHVYPPESAGRTARPTSTSMTSTCSRATAPAGRCAPCCTRASTVCPARWNQAPPRHLSSALGQMVNFLGTLQNEWAGAQAFSSVDTYLAPYIRKDALSYESVRQSMQELVYNLNVPSRWGTQTPFTNLTFDWVCPDDLKEQVPVIGGEEMPFAYGDLQVEMDMINRPTSR
jgi:anaerobic ribonucleoside-triphosphate reductase